MCNHHLVAKTVEQRKYHKGRWNRILIDGLKLTDARLTANLSIIDVAVALGCNKSSVSRWEMGRLVPSQERIEKLAEIYGTRQFIRGNPNYGQDLRQLKRKKKVEGI